MVFYGVVNVLDTAIGVSLKADSGGEKYREAIHKMNETIMYR